MSVVLKVILLTSNRFLSSGKNAWTIEQSNKKERFWFATCFVCMLWFHLIAWNEINSKMPLRFLILKCETITKRRSVVAKTMCWKIYECDIRFCTCDV